MENPGVQENIIFIGDPSETFRRLICLIENPSKIYRRPICLIGDRLETSTCFIGDLSETDMPQNIIPIYIEFTKILLFSETYRRTIGDPSENHRRAIGDQSKTEMPDRRQIEDLDMLHLGLTCPTGDQHA